MVFPFDLEIDDNSEPDLRLKGNLRASLPWTPARISAVVIGLPSLALLVLARIQLGGSFSVRPKAHALVTHGLYSRIRNPIYVFGGLAIAGAFLYIDQPRYLWLFVVLIPLQIYRARQEEKVLEARFGDEYRQYKWRTWFAAGGRADAN